MLSTEANTAFCSMSLKCHPPSEGSWYSIGNLPQKIFDKIFLTRSNVDNYDMKLLGFTNADESSLTQPVPNPIMTWELWSKTHHRCKCMHIMLHHCKKIAFPYISILLSSKILRNRQTHKQADTHTQTYSPLHCEGRANYALHDLWSKALLRQSP